MPTISEFFGIVVRRYYDDHHPPHFHGYYGDSEAVILIETLAMAEGNLPRRARAMVLEWAADHHQELVDDWMFAAEHRPLNKIMPLE